MERDALGGETRDSLPALGPFEDVAFDVRDITVWAIPHTEVMATCDDFITELEAEARAEGPEAIAELEAFRLHFSLARQLAARRRSVARCT